MPNSSLYPCPSQHDIFFSIPCNPKLCISIPLVKFLYRQPLLSPSSETIYNSPRYSISALLFLSSLACVFLGPHRSIFLSSLPLSHCKCSGGAGAAICTKTVEHSNLRASFCTLHVRGSSLRRRRISSMCSFVRLYFGWRRL